MFVKLAYRQKSPAMYKNIAGLFNINYGSNVLFTFPFYFIAMLNVSVDI